MAFDQNIAPFLSLGRRYPADLFVHEHYQDAIWNYGIKGHLRVLTERYQALSLQHEGELISAAAHDGGTCSFASQPFGAHILVGRNQFGTPGD
jgi:hypothetical protein